MCDAKYGGKVSIPAESECIGNGSHCLRGGSKIQNSVLLSSGTSGSLSLREKRAFGIKNALKDLQRKRAFNGRVTNRQLLTHVVTKRVWAGRGKVLGSGVTGMDSSKATLKGRIIKRCGDKWKNNIERSFGCCRLVGYFCATGFFFFLSQGNTVELICLDCSKMLGSELCRTRAGKPEKGRIKRQIAGG